MRGTRIGTRRSRGLTFLEVLYVCMVVMVLTAIAVPAVRIAAKRFREVELRRNLASIRRAIDAYHRDAINNVLNMQFVEPDMHPIGKWYPPRLQTLVDGVPLAQAPDQIRKYLRRIPPDPFNFEGSDWDEGGWKLRAYQDDPDERGWSGRNVWDVHSASERTALDGSTYDQW